VRSISPRVELFRKTHADPETALGYRRLGELAAHEQSQVTVEVGYLGAEDVNSYAGLVNSGSLSDERIVVGDLVEFCPKTRDLPGTALLWIIDALRRPLH